MSFGVSAKTNNMMEENAHVQALGSLIVVLANCLPLLLRKFLLQGFIDHLSNGLLGRNSRHLLSSWLPAPQTLSTIAPRTIGPDTSSDLLANVETVLGFCDFSDASALLGVVLAAGDGEEEGEGDGLELPFELGLGLRLGLELEGDDCWLTGDLAARVGSWGQLLRSRRRLSAGPHSALPARQCPCLMYCA